MSAKEYNGVGSECLMTIDDMYVQYLSYGPRRVFFPSTELPIR
eukprot:COSAG02_NODE_33025_length_506_cov_19.668305_1_plen_42_part_10